jgi:hypothetical protein
VGQRIWLTFIGKCEDHDLIYSYGWYLWLKKFMVL